MKNVQIKIDLNILNFNCYTTNERFVQAVSQECTKRSLYVYVHANNQQMLDNSRSVPLSIGKCKIIVGSFNVRHTCGRFSRATKISK